MKTYFELSLEVIAWGVGIGSLIMIGISQTAPDSMIRHLTQLIGGW